MTTLHLEESDEYRTAEIHLGAKGENTELNFFGPNVDVFTAIRLTDRERHLLARALLRTDEKVVRVVR